MIWMTAGFHIVRFMSHSAQKDRADEPSNDTSPVSITHAGHGPVAGVEFGLCRNALQRDLSTADGPPLQLGPSCARILAFVTSWRAGLFGRTALAGRLLGCVGSQNSSAGRQDYRVSSGRRSSPSLRVAKSSVIAAANYVIWRIVAGGRILRTDSIRRIVASAPMRRKRQNHVRIKS